MQVALAAAAVLTAAAVVTAAAAACLVQPEIVQAPVWSSCLLPGGLCCLPGVAEAPLEQPWEPAGERELLWEQALAAELHRSYLGEACGEQEQGLGEFAGEQAGGYAENAVVAVCLAAEVLVGHCTAVPG